MIDSFFVGSYDEKPIRDYTASFALPAQDSLLAAPWTLLWESQGGVVRNLGGEIRGDSLLVRLDRFGQFRITQDTFPPRIRAIRLPRTMNRHQEIIFQISDNWEVSGKAREPRYRATMNGQWVLFRHDLKSQRIRFSFPPWMKPGKYDLRLSVWDDRDNETVFTHQIDFRG